MKNKLILLCAPSGTGKTTVARLLCSTDRRFYHVQVLTTREIRYNEEGGTEKVQVLFDDLVAMNLSGELVSFNEKDGVHYGIKHDEISIALDRGGYPVLEWDLNQLNYWDDLFPTFKVILKPASKVKILQTLKDGRDPRGSRELGVMSELKLIDSGHLRCDLLISNFDSVLFDTVQKIRTALIKLA